MVGNNDGSYGYHGLRGYRRLGKYSTQEQYGPKYGKGDTVGLVYNRAIGALSFTRNGVHLGVCAKNIPNSENICLMISFAGPTESSESQ